MVPLDALLQGIAALVTGSFGVMLVLQGGRGSSSRTLGVFLLLIAANQTLETFRVLTTDPRRQVLEFRLASVAAALDPVVLYVFASRHPALNELAQPRRIALALAAGGAMTFWAALLGSMGQSDPPVRAFNATIAVETLALYGVVVAWSARRYFRAPSSPADRYLFVALTVMAIPVVGRIVDAAQLFVSLPPDIYGPAGPEPYFLAAEVLLTAAGVGAFLAWALARSPPEARRTVLGATLGGFGVQVIVARGYAISSVLHAAGLVPVVSDLDAIGHAGTAIRWLLFCGFASVALFRHDLLGLSLAARRRAARLLITLTLAVLGGVVAAAAGASLPGFGLTPAELLAMGILLILSQGFRNGVDRIATRVYGVPMPGDRVAALELYRLAAVEATERGSPARDPALARLRDELGLDPSSARLIEDLAERAHGAPLAEGQVVSGRYRVERVLGRGGGGRAFLAEDETLRRRVVLKEIPVAGERESDAALAEARAASALQHPNVITLHDVLRRQGIAVLVTEYLPGGSLEERLSSGPLAPEEAERALLGVLRGLAAVHATGLVHGDVKPSNVLLTAEGEPKIADFGLARLRWAQTLGADEGLRGTPAYMAPEQLRGERATAASDVYAAGVLARRLRPAWPPATEAALARALAQDARERWRDAGEMLAALR